MSMRAGVFGAALAAVIVAGCVQGQPGKDVAAVVAGETVTVAELDRELANAGMAQQAKNPAIRRAALEEIVVRKLLAKAARADGLDKSPQALEAKRVSDESFDANLDRINTIATTPAPTPAEVRAYIGAHPEKFAQRTGYVIEQLQIPQRHTPDLFEDLRPTKTLAEAEAVLQARRIPFRRVVLPMDTLRADPRLSSAVAKLPPGEPFVLPGVSSFTINSVRGSQVRPVTGPQAEAIAGEMMRAERINKALKTRLDTLRKEQVVYGPEFQPKAADTRPSAK